MPEKQWVFDTVVLSNFLLSDSAHILEKRYKSHGVITPAVYDEISAGMSQIRSLQYIDKLIEGGIFSLCPLTRQEHDYFKKMITFLGKGEDRRNIWICSGNRANDLVFICSQFLIRDSGLPRRRMKRI